jgi:ribosomal protein L14E/L6E/L27E
LISGRNWGLEKYFRDWLVANVTALFKKGDESQPVNYRPVSLTSVPCKIMEHVIFKHIMNHLDKHNTVPCGTPDVTLAVLDFSPSMVTCCSRCVSHASSHDRMFPFMPYDSSFVSRRLCGTVSKALLNEPKDWLVANVTALFQKGDKSQPVNYRPVSLTSVPCKIMEHVIFKH